MSDMKLIKLKDLPDDFRVGLEDRFRLKLFKNAIKKVGNLSLLAKQLNISRTTLLGMAKGYEKNRKRFIKISLLRELSNITSIPLEIIEKNIKELIAGKVSIKIRLPIVAKDELASLVGHVFGDGYIKKNGEQFQFFNKDLELIKEVKESIKSIFGVEVNEHLRKNPKIFELYIPSTIAKILIFLGAPQGKKNYTNSSCTKLDKK